MAGSFIAIDTNTRLGGTLRRAIDTLSAGRDQLAHVNDVMATMVSGTDYSLIESQFGIPAGKGQEVYTLLSTAVAAIQGSSVLLALNQLG